MYFPYLRGRQYELLAVRELASQGDLSENVIPIIEPVKLSMTLIKTISVLINKNRVFGIIENPQVGSFLKDCKEEKNEKLFQLYQSEIRNANNILHTLIVKSKIETEAFINKNGNRKLATVIHDKDAAEIYKETFQDVATDYNLMVDERGIWRRVGKNKVLLDNKFNVRERNKDYAEIDEPFSEDHLYYKEDGYIGFSDYSIAGDKYKEFGFAPIAVAIHIVYFDKEKSLRIKHFVSKTNLDIHDQARKFGEALEELIEWNKDKKLNTSAMRAFEKLYKEESYPGLGTIKKLSIMHHLELVGQFLDGSKK